ncbi:MAG: hypothetical protein LBC76_03970 [Treponema sp.]|jgi:hypothetical protein|nr:hypothetical protein [Treponema sp.]
MKNKIKLIGFIALMAIIGFSMIVCNSGSGGGGSNNNNNNNNSGGGDTLTFNRTGDKNVSNPFMGTWTTTSNGWALTIIAEDTTWTYTESKGSTSYTDDGTYSHTNTTASFINTDGSTWGTATLSSDGNKATVKRN